MKGADWRPLVGEKDGPSGRSGLPRRLTLSVCGARHNARVPEPSDPRFLDVLNKGHVDALRALGRTRRFPVGAPLFHEREPGEAVLVLTAGRVKLSCVTEGGREALLGIREPGDLIGEMSALDGGPRSATATALEPVEVIAVSREAFSGFLERTPGVALVLARMIARRLRDADSKRIEYLAGELHEARADAADRVLGQVLDALAVGVAQAAGDHPREHERHPGRAFQEGGERLPGDRDDLDRLERRGGR